MSWNQGEASEPEIIEDRSDELIVEILLHIQVHLGFNY